MVEKNHPLYGKFVAPIRAFIEDESDKQEKTKTILDVLFNVEKSNRFAEAVVSEGGFGTFMAKEEGQRAENMSIDGGMKKVIEHIEFAGEFTITKKMADDANLGISTEMKSRPRKFTRAYYKTRVKAAAQALIHGTEAEMTFNKAQVDLTTSDGKPLFSSEHTYSSDNMKGKTQSNYLYGEITKDTATLEEALNVLANKMRNFKDENGEIMGYVADTLIIPCNRPKLEMMAKQICGSEITTGMTNGFQTINTQFGNWTLIILDEWTTEDDRFMIMSSEANENLMGNMFYNRVPLDIISEVDPHTRNMFVNGYCRFGVGFSTWKHMLLAVNSTDEVDGATAIA
jgi:hypothetical protein